MAGPTAVVDYGKWTDPLAIATICVTVPLMFLFSGNRQLWPLAQREPQWALLANFSFQFVILMFLFEKQHPELPLWWTKVYSQLGWGIMLCLYFVRTWKLYIDAGLTNERVRHKFGWFVNHRHYRSPSFLSKLILVLVAFHIAIVPVQFALIPANNIPARQLDHSVAGPLLFATIVLTYFVVYAIFGFKLRGVRDGFYIKMELSLVGIGGCSLTLLWLIFAALKLPCVLPSCTVLIAWLVSAWVFAWSIAFPLAVASRDPRFSFAGSLSRWRRQGTTTKEEFREADSPHSGEGISEYHESAIDMKSQGEDVQFSGEKLARLKHIPLVKFLNNPQGREAFRAFTVLEFSVENLLFVEAVMELRAQPHSTVAEMKVLWDRFVAEGAPNQVNLPSVLLHRAKARLEQEGDVSGLDQAVEHVLKLMQRDTYKRFQKTPEWQKHVVVFDKAHQVEMAQTGSLEPDKQRNVDNAQLLHPAAQTSSVEPGEELETPDPSNHPIPDPEPVPL